MNEKSLFRQKSIDKISSPEELNDYIRVSNPGVWMMLVSVILVLLGMVTWGVFGRLETRISVPAIVRENEATLYIEADHVMEVNETQEMEINGYKGSVTGRGIESMKAGDVLGDLIRTEAGLDEEDVVFLAEGEIDVPDGIYMAEIITDSVSPMSFLTGNN